MFPRPESKSWTTKFPSGSAPCIAPAFSSATAPRSACLAYLIVMFVFFSSSLMPITKMAPTAREPVSPNDSTVFAFRL